MNPAYNLRQCIKEIDQAARTLEIQGKGEVLNYDQLVKDVLDALGVTIVTKSKQVVVSIEDEDRW